MILIFLQQSDSRLIQRQCIPDIALAMMEMVPVGAIVVTVAFRMARSNGKEKEALEKEIFMEEEKIKIEQNAMAIEQKLEQGMNSFNNLLRQAIQILKSTAYPADAAQHLSQARMGLKDIVSIIDEMRRFENKLLQLTKSEKIY